jgi:hypothetical protein
MAETKNEDAAHNSTIKGAIVKFAKHTGLLEKEKKKEEPAK